ncbi:CcdC family protein [Paenibacillus thalictri]|uniref:Cytochrome c biogenesis protein CcdC n=1 Tax=Paenibacillus thalictri TaxID=2527873 RepID=A0A4Q9DTT9_9BACL|nr:cytochrome c biogenesis protein CcdC [Paenibacillus thalictri]TBL78627.1 cytochrome c biogenesis protein CcdC [Paenibacillus thalictri]
MNLGSLNIQTTATIGVICMAVLSIFIRLKAGSRPVTAKKIMIPPLGMSTGFLMFAVPLVRISWEMALVAFLVGACLFSVPLILTTRFQITDGQVYMKRSKWFAFILIGLLIIRLALHNIVEQYISIPQTGAVFFLLAFGMILPWRLAMFRQYSQLLAHKDRPASMS